MDKEEESLILAKLKNWGLSMGNNLLVAPWDIADNSYITFAQKVGITRLPSIVLTDNNNPCKDSFLIIIDELSVVKNVNILTEILPNIVNYILVGNRNAAIKDALRERQSSRIKSLLSPITSTISKAKKLDFSFAGFSAGIELR